MITLYLQRITYLPNCTMGKLYTPKQSFCTVEDAYREIDGVPVSSWKVPGKTAIPQGMYPLVLDMSNRFQKIMPHILNVPGFEGVRIHAGNTSLDTEGCLLLGRNYGEDGESIVKSRNAVEAFMAELDGYYDIGTPVQIQIGGESP